MTDEEKKAIEIIENVRVSLINFNEITEKYIKVVNAIQTALNLIKEQQKELELKDKVIDEMAVNISEAETFIAQNYGIYTEFDKEDKEYVINTFTNKAKEYYAGFNKNKVKENKE